MTHEQARNGKGRKPGLSRTDPPQFAPIPCSSMTNAEPGSTASGGGRVPPQLSSPPDGRVNVKMHCIFCTDAVPSENLNEDPSHPDNQELRKMLKSLYYNFQLNPQEVPQNCTGMMFPFCTPCKNQVKEIHQDQRAIEEAKKRIAKNLGNIEEVVAEGELLKPKSVVKSEKVESTKLTEKILDGIRSKLLMQKLLRKSLNQGQDFAKNYPRVAMKFPSISHNIIVRDDKIRAQFDDINKMKTLRHSTTEVSDDSDSGVGGSLGSVEESGSGMTVEVNPAVVFPDIDQKTQPHSQTQSENTNVIHGQYNENSCSMVISDVRSESESGPATPIVAEEEDDIVVLKKEERLEDTGVFVCDPNGRQRRSIFRGVSIYRVMESGRVGLQCGACLFMVPITESALPGCSPHDRMTQHIMTEHHARLQSRTKLINARLARRQGRARRLSTIQATDAVSALQPARRDSGKSLKFQCMKCPEKFPSIRLRREHNIQVHKSQARKAFENPKNSYQQMCQIFDCDICGRPVRGTFTNFMSHKFSHKNDEERKIAIANNELGARQSMLSRNGFGLNKRRKVNGKVKGKNVRKRHRKRTSKLNNIPKSGPSVATTSNNQWKCYLRECGRVFSKQNHYTNHMKMHVRKQGNETLGSNARVSVTWQPRVQPPPALPATSSSSDMQVAARVPPLTLQRRQQLFIQQNGEDILIGHRIDEKDMAARANSNVEVYVDRNGCD